MRRSPAQSYLLQDGKRIAISATTVKRLQSHGLLSRITLDLPRLLCVPRSGIVTDNAPVSRHYQPVIGN